MQIIRTIKNIWLFRKFLKEYRWNDYEHILTVLTTILDDMEKNTKEKAVLDNKMKKAFQMRKISLMFKSLTSAVEDPFDYNVTMHETDLKINGIPVMLHTSELQLKKHIPFSKDHIIESEESMARERLKLAFGELGRVITNFWD